MYVLVRFIEKPKNVIVVSMFKNIDFESMIMSQKDFDRYQGKSIASAEFIQMSEGTEVSNALRLEFTDGDYVVLGICWLIKGGKL